MHFAHALPMIVALLSIAFTGLAASITFALNATPTGPYSKSWNVTASADADAAGTVSHGFPSAPAMVWLVPLLSANAYGKQWALTAVSATTIIITGVSSTSSGTSVAQLQLIAMLPHSLID
jgi:hypothetical protein